MSNTNQAEIGVTNDLPFRKELPIIFEHFTNWNKDKINTNNDIKTHYINWLEYQLYLYYINKEESDIFRYYDGLIDKSDQYGLSYYDDAH